MAEVMLGEKKLVDRAEIRIDRAQLLKLADGLGKSDYGVYLRGLADDDYVA